TFGLPSNAPVDTYTLVYDAALGRLKYAAQAGGGGGGRSEFPGTLMNLVRSGTSAAPMYMYLTGTGASITMTSSAAKTDKGRQAQITNGAGNAARFGWNTSQNNCAAMVDVVGLRGGKFTKGAWVYCTTADRVKLEVSDGTTTTTSAAYHGGGGWERMEVTLGADVAAGATVLTAYVLIEAGAAITVYVELPCVAKGTSCPEHVGYQGGGRTYNMYFGGTGSRSLTGCGFSPTAAIFAWNIDSGCAGDGFASLRGATKYTSFRADEIEYGSGKISYYNASNYSTLSSFDTDGLTINIVGNTTRLVALCLEGNPV
ncbi:MAG: hypothetical protein KJ621_16450, partial [Proteobacteria bacterium]|nr:hypothetical protein [Pseudomonadota bacterium]